MEIQINVPKTTDINITGDVRTAVPVNGSVTKEKIADGAVTEDKLGDDVKTLINGFATKEYVDESVATEAAERSNAIVEVVSQMQVNISEASELTLVNAKEYSDSTLEDAKIYADSVSWNAPGFLEYKGLLDLSNVVYTSGGYFTYSIDDLDDLSTAKFDNLTNPVTRGCKYFYWVKLLGENLGDEYKIMARLYDDGSSGAWGDGYLTNRTQTIYLDNGQVFQRSRNSSYNDEMENIEYWEAWTPTSSVPYATSEARGAVKVGGIAAVKSYAVMQRANISVTDFNKTDYTYHGQYSVSFNGSTLGAPQGLDSDTTYYGVLTTENYSNTNTASSNYGAYQKLSIPILNRTYERYVYDGAERYGDWTCITEAIKPLTVDNWKAVQEIVRSGMARQVFNIGDQLVCQRNGQDLVWDIIGIDHDTPADSQYTHSMTIQLHGCIRGASIPRGIAGRQALFYAEEELPAGTYNFTTTPDAYTRLGGGKTYSFTITKPVPAGGQIYFDINDVNQFSTRYLITYGSQTSTAQIEKVSVTEGADGTALETLGACNNSWYMVAGSNNYTNAMIRQWLNSEGGAGEWWQPNTTFERHDGYVASSPAFLYGIDRDFLEVIGAVQKKAVLNNVIDGGKMVDFTDRFFLLSNSEVYSSANTAEGAAYEYYEKYSDHESPSPMADSNRIKYSLNTNNLFAWWTRTASSSQVNLSNTVENDGRVNIHGSSAGYGEYSPACCIV